MFEVIYRDQVIRRFSNLNKAFHFLIAEGWEWDDKARVRKVSV